MLSEEDADKTRYIHFNDSTQKYEVQYDAEGTIGTPIVQPNKYEYLRRIAFRVGRDIRTLSELIDTGSDDQGLLEAQNTALAQTLKHMQVINPQHAVEDGAEDALEAPAAPSGKEISLKKIARDLVKVAPELVKDAGLDFSIRSMSTMTNKEAAKLVQMQLIEESNNNWESRFPENEHVWDWVDDPLQITEGVNSQALGGRTRDSTKQFFSMRKWPVDCQSLERQAMIKTSDPTFPDEVEDPQPVPESTAEQRMAKMMGPPPRERYTGRRERPYFPFGETPYQQAFLSWRMEQDLKDGQYFPF